MRTAPGRLRQPARRPGPRPAPASRRAAVVGALPGVAAVVLAAGLRLWPASRPTGNLFYDAAVRSMGLSWHNFFFGAIEPGGSVSIDKPPGDLWLQVASTKLLGFTTFALHLPEALAGTAAVGMLYCVVRSVWGPLAGGLAGFALAVLPISVLTSRSDTMDSVTMALLVAALWASVRALQTRRWTWVLASAGLVGVAFNVKLAQALIPLPGLAVMWWAAGRRRAGGGRSSASARGMPILLAAGAVVVVVSMSWITIASLTPVRDRPYPVGSGNGSIYRVVFLFNGLDRIRGSSPQLGSSDPTLPGPLRLFGARADYDQLIGVELATALALALAVGLVGRIRPAGIRRVGSGGGDAEHGHGHGREDEREREHSDGHEDEDEGEDEDADDHGYGHEHEHEHGTRVALWTAAGLGIWLVTAVGLLSGIRQLQTRYLETASPAVAAVLGVCAAGLIGRLVRGDDRGADGDARLARAPRWALAAAIGVGGLYGIASATDTAGRLAGGAGVAGGVVLAWWAGGRRGLGVVGACAIVGLAVLALPLRVSVDVIGRGFNDATHGGSGAQYAGFLRAHRGRAHYEAASGDTLGVVGLIATDAQPVLILEDVKGPLVRLARLERLVRRGAVRYVLIDHPCTNGRRCPSVISWSVRHAVRIRGYLYAYTASASASAVCVGVGVESSGLRPASRPYEAVRRPENARPRVTSSAYSRSEPTGRPLASRVTRISDERRRRPAATWSAVASPVVVGLVARTTSRTGASGSPIRSISSAIRRSSGSMPSIGERAPPRTW